MLAIRLQRTGRKGHAQFRVVVQDARRTPSSGRFVAQLGSYNPHTKEVILDKEKVSFYLGNGARPSDRVAHLLQSQGVALPAWVNVSAEKQRSIRNPEKLRKNQPSAPVEEEAEAPAEAEEVAEAPAAAEATESPAETAENAEEA